MGGTATSTLPQAPKFGEHSRRSGQKEYRSWKIGRSDVASRHDMAVTHMNSAAVVTYTRPAQKQQLNIPALRPGGLWRSHPWARELWAAGDSLVGRVSCL